MGFQALRCEGQPALHARTVGDDSVHTAQGGHMEFGCFFVGQRPLLHEQYRDGQQRNPLPIARTDAQVYHEIGRAHV